MKTSIEKWTALSWDQLLEVPELKTGIQRNKKLIDLSEIPKNISDAIIEQYNNLVIQPKKTNIINYFQQHKLSSLMENANDFT